ncbi:MFS general substrate transporter [Aspergillus phoenicis ATCC 13157]|uniref:MFS general substrate transporter n=1 Tax=Aspergillus phoenicis ATCC 13157 TaxID=1353007 RepID=A0A370PDQ0_ASPPH|nr:MFS general substrate transporter [Aspergillus phoenicis ATCC 13157]
MKQPEEAAATRPSTPDGSEKMAISKEMDGAAKYLAQTSSYPPMTQEIEKRLLRKIDWILVPMLLLTATLGAVDKVALSTAAIYGLEEDLHLVGQDYSWAGSILSIGSIVGMWPSSFLVQRLPSAKYLSSCSLGWSCMALLIPACKNWSGLMAIRFFMGCLEAIIVPSISLIVAGFYKKSEQPPRNAIVFAAFSSVINGFLSWLVGHVPDSAPLAIWQYLYLIVGSISALWSIIAIMFLPDSPMNAFFLTDQEKYYAVQRLAENRTGIINKEWKWNQALEAAIDPKTWILYALHQPLDLTDGIGLTTFSGIIIDNLGFSAVNTSLLNMPTGIMSTLAAFVFSWLAARWTGRRCLVTMIACCLPIIGSALVYSLPRTNIGGQMVGIYLLYTYFGPYVVANNPGISMAQANTAGHTKKTVQYSILYIGYAVGNLIGPQTFRANQAPAYTGGFIAMLVCYCICVALMAVYWILVVKLNRRLLGHVRCTEELPKCHRCERLGLHCERGLQLLFQEDAVQRGISFGRKGAFCFARDRTVLKYSDVFYGIPLDAYMGRWIFLNSTSSDFMESSSDSGEMDTDGIEPDLLSALGHPLAAYSHLESYLIDYFIHGIGPSCSLSPIENPYITLLTPLALSHKTLRDALISAAGNQLRLLGDNRFTKEALIYKNRALKGLQQEIELGSISDGAIATVLMLCFHDISDECAPSWVTHLQGGLDLLYQFPCKPTANYSLRRFFNMYFVAHAIMSRTATPQFCHGNGMFSWSENDDLDEIDTIMGCSRRLMLLINDISELPEAARIATALINIKQFLPKHSSDRNDLARIAETKRLAAIIYLFNRIDGTAYYTDVMNETKSDKNTFISALINVMSHLPDTATLLWPLYILGHASLEDEDHRRFVLDRLERMQRTRNLGSVRRARMAVKHAFRVVDVRSTARVRASKFGYISLA